MANLFQELNSIFRIEQQSVQGGWIVTIDSPQNKKPVAIMKSGSKTSADCSRNWLERAASGQFNDETVVNELVQVPQHFYFNAGIALIKTLAHRANLKYDEANHCLSRIAIPASTPTHLLFGNAFIKVKIPGMNPPWGIEKDGQLVFISMQESEANPLIVWLNQIANDPSAKNLDIAEWLVRNVVERQLNFDGACLVRDMCTAAGAVYDMTQHTITKPGGTPPSKTPTTKMGDWLDEREAEQDTFGIGKPGAKSTKQWEPDEPDPSVDLLKSIRDICDGSRI